MQFYINFLQKYDKNNLTVKYFLSIKLKKKSRVLLGRKKNIIMFNLALSVEWSIDQLDFIITIVNLYYF